MPFAVRHTQMVLGTQSDGELVAVPAASVVIRKDGVNVQVYSNRAKALLGTPGTPLPTGVPNGSAGVDSMGNMVVWLDADDGYDMVATVGGVSTTVPLPTITPDVEDVQAPIPPGTYAGVPTPGTPATALVTSGDQTFTGTKRGTVLRSTLDVVLTGIAATDTANIQAALATVTNTNPTTVRLIRGTAAWPGDEGVINDTLVVGPGATLEANTMGVLNAGVRLKWTGAVGGTMVRCTGQRSFVRNIRLDANDLAATCISYEGNSERQGYEDLACENFTGSGFKLGDNVANHNGFRGHGALYLRGNAGSTAMVVDSVATEDIHLGTVNITPASGEGAMARCLDIVRGIVTIDDLLLDDDNMLGYAVRIQDGALGIGNLTSEMKQTLTMTNVGRGRGSYILTGDIRIAEVQAGQFVLDFNGTGAGFFLGTVRINRKAAAVNAPNVNVNGMAVISLASFTSSDAGAVGKIIATSTGSVVEMGAVTRLGGGAVLDNNKAIRSYLDGTTTPVDLLHLPSTNVVVVGSHTATGITGVSLRTPTGDIDFRAGAAADYRATFSGTIADGETAFLVRRNVGGTLSLQRVSMGAVDSGGAGFKVLRVPN